jgi:hypothetical protein
MTDVLWQDVDVHVDGILISAPNFFLSLLLPCAMNHSYVEALESR